MTMTSEDILKLGRLSRIALTPTEITDFTSSLDAIVAYVSVVKDIAAGDEGSDTTPTLGARYNVLRPDEITHPSGTYTDVLLKAMPKRDGQYLSVKKILNPIE